MKQPRARALWYCPPGRGEIRSASLAAPAADEVLVRAEFGALSLGTESLVYQGRIPESEHKRMQAPYQRGSFPGPVCYGYSVAGVAIDGDPSLIGKRVFCLHPHQDRFVVPSHGALTVPAGVPSARAVLAPNVETAFNAVADAGLRDGARVQVAGAGVVGLAIAHLASSLAHADVEVVEPKASRRQLAQQLGIRAVVPGEARRENSTLFECSGRGAVLSESLPRLASEGTAIVVSWYGDEAVSLRLGEDFHARRLTLRSSQVGAVAPSLYPMTHRERLARALELLEDERFDRFFDDEYEYAFEKLPSVLPDLTSPDYTGLCPRIRYSQESTTDV